LSSILQTSVRLSIFSRVSPNKIIYLTDVAKIQHMSQDSHAMIHQSKLKGINMVEGNIDKQTVLDKVILISAELSGVDLEDDYNGCFKVANKVLNDLYELVKE